MNLNQSPSLALTEALKPFQQMGLIIRSAFLFSVLILAGCSYYLFEIQSYSNIGQNPARPIPPIEIFLIFGAVLAVSAGFIRMIGMSDTFLRQGLKRSSDAASLAKSHKIGAVDQNLVTMLSNLNHLDLRIFRVIRGSNLMMMIFLVLSEALAILGFIYSYLSLNFENGLPFFGVSLLLQAIGYPSISKIEDRARTVARDMSFEK